MKFLTDSNVGRLTRFLRIFGFDTIYAEDVENSAPDNTLLEYAIAHDRIIITRDLPFHQKAKERSIYLEGEGVYNYLNQIKQKLNLEYDFSMSNARCSICNGILKKVEDNETVRTRVKEDTYNHYNEFYQCIECEKVYWAGSHVNKILQKLKEN